MAIVREIKYFDYMENEIKRGNAGHIKVDWWEGVPGGGERAEGALRIHLNHLSTEYIPGSLGDNPEVLLQTARGQITLGNIEIKSGSGVFECSLEPLQAVLGEDITYEDIWSISIPWGGKHQLFCQIHEPRFVAAQELELHKGGTQECENSYMETAVVEMNPTETETAERLSSEEKEQEREQMKKILHTSYGEDKWSHLCSIYPKITPFSDSREYLKIGPNDFVVLHQKYYSLVHNSFMLHGYYQYGQLVLCRVLRRGKPLYYLGTPGLYLEQDKQVALMYGFQSFECDNEPAAEGDFGYYMIQVEL